MSGLSIRRPATSLRTQHCEIKYKKPPRGVGQKFRCAFPTDRWRSHAEIFFPWRQLFDESNTIKTIKSLISQLAADASAKLSIYFPAGGGGIEISGAFRSGTGWAATRIFSMNSEIFF